MKKLGILIGIVALCFGGCSKDKVEDILNNPSGSNPAAGAPYTYHLKIEEGADAGFEMSAEVPNEDCISLYTSESGTSQKIITFLINGAEMTLGGSFATDANGNVLTNIEEGWYITMLPINKTFFLKSGSVNVSNVNYIGLPQSGFASFKIGFEGWFHQNIDEEDLYRISGTIVVNQPAM